MDLSKLIQIASMIVTAAGGSITVSELIDEVNSSDQPHPMVVTSNGNKYINKIMRSNGKPFIELSESIGTADNLAFLDRNSILEHLSHFDLNDVVTVVKKSGGKYVKTNTTVSGVYTVGKSLDIHKLISDLERIDSGDIPEIIPSGYESMHVSNVTKSGNNVIVTAVSREDAISGVAKPLSKEDLISRLTAVKASTGSVKVKIGDKHVPLVSVKGIKSTDYTPKEGLNSSSKPMAVFDFKKAVTGMRDVPVRVSVFPESASLLYVTGINFSGSGKAVVVTSQTCDDKCMTALSVLRTLDNAPKSISSVYAKVSGKEVPVTGVYAVKSMSSKFFIDEVGKVPRGKIPSLSVDGVAEKLYIKGLDTSGSNIKIDLTAVSGESLPLNDIVTKTSGKNTGSVKATYNGSIVSVTSISGGSSLDKLIKSDGTSVGDADDVTDEDPDLLHKGFKEVKAKDPDKLSSKDEALRPIIDKLIGNENLAVKTMSFSDFYDDISETDSEHAMVKISDGRELYISKIVSIGDGITLYTTSLPSMTVSAVLDQLLKMSSKRGEVLAKVGQSDFPVIGVV